jgi:hypothetical protein
MKALFGVAVFGLLPVPPMPVCDALAGGRDDHPVATEDMRKSRLESHANGSSDEVAKDAPAPARLDDIDAALTPDVQRG